MENNIKYCLTTPIVVQFGPTHYTRTADKSTLDLRCAPHVQLWGIRNYITMFIFFGM